MSSIRVHHRCNKIILILILVLVLVLVLVLENTPPRTNSHTRRLPSTARHCTSSSALIGSAKTARTDLGLESPSYIIAVPWQSKMPPTRCVYPWKSVFIRGEKNPWQKNPWQKKSVAKKSVAKKHPWHPSPPGPAAALRNSFLTTCGFPPPLD
ncbi:MAG: hypothetical protein ACKO3T_25320 [Planctomycetaceae bacterium]